jgi:hypothetical protein
MLYCATAPDLEGEWDEHFYDEGEGGLHTWPCMGEGRWLALVCSTASTWCCQQQTLLGSGCNVLYCATAPDLEGVWGVCSGKGGG